MKGFHHRHTLATVPPSNHRGVKTLTEDKQPSPTDDTAELDFESALEELEGLVTRMESGDLSLDESLKAFERGVILARHCQTELQSAELRIQQLTDEGDLVEFDDDADA